MQYRCETSLHGRAFNRSRQNSPLIRPHVKKLVERFIPNLVVLSHNEVAQDVRIEALGVVELSG